MAVGGLAARVIEVVQKREALDQSVRVRGVDAAEDRQGRVAIAGGYVAQDLIVGAVFTNDHEHVLDWRRITDPLRDCMRRVMRVAPRGRLDI